MRKYYAIKSNDEKLIVESWDEAQSLIKGMENPKYKSFLSLEEANAFLDDIILDDGVTEPKCYIDGSFNKDTEEYSFGGVLIVDNKIQEFMKCYKKDRYSKERNVAGEIKGAGFIINYCINHGIKRLHIFYDYLGIEKWYTEEWKAESLIGKKYQEFAISVKDKIEVIFHKVKGHSNNHYNEMADKLAKKALGL